MPSTGLHAPQGEPRVWTGVARCSRQVCHTDPIGLQLVWSSWRSRSARWRFFQAAASSPVEEACDRPRSPASRFSGIGTRCTGTFAAGARRGLPTVFEWSLAGSRQSIRCPGPATLVQGGHVGHGDDLRPVRAGEADVVAKWPVWIFVRSPFDQFVIVAGGMTSSTRSPAGGAVVHENSHHAGRGCSPRRVDDDLPCPRHSSSFRRVEHDESTAVRDAGVLSHANVLFVAPPSSKQLSQRMFTPGGDTAAMAGTASVSARTCIEEVATYRSIPLPQE
jgi:hypothetical protein